MVVLGFFASPRHANFNVILKTNRKLSTSILIYESKYQLRDNISFLKVICKKSRKPEFLNSASPHSEEKLGQELDNIS